MCPAARCLILSSYLKSHQPNNTLSSEFPHPSAKDNLSSRVQWEDEKTLSPAMVRAISRNWLVGATGWDKWVQEAHLSPEEGSPGGLCSGTPGPGKSLLLLVPRGPADPPCPQEHHHEGPGTAGRRSPHFPQGGVSCMTPRRSVPSLSMCHTLKAGSPCEDLLGLPGPWEGFLDRSLTVLPRRGL